MNALLLCFIISITCSVRIDISIYDNNNTVLLPIKLGTPKQDLNVLIDTGSLMFWVREYNDNPNQTTFNSGFVFENSSSFKTNNDSQMVMHNTLSTIGRNAYETLNIETIDLNQYPFILVDHSNLGKSIDGVFGLAYNQSSSSILSTLLSQQIISQRIFLLDIANELLQIGSFPEDIQNDIEHFSYCRVNQTIRNMPNKSWKCFLTGIYSQGNSTNYIQEDIYIEFNSIINAVLVSYGLLYNLFTYFLPIEYKDKCALIVRKKWFTVECNEFTDLTLLSDLKLQFGSMTIVVPKEKLFSQQGKTYVLLFKTHSKFDYWKIGLPVLRQFKIVFDIDKSIVGFYSNKSLVINEYDIDKDEIFISYKAKEKHWALIRSSCVFISIVCLIGIALNMYFTYWSKFVT